MRPLLSKIGSRVLAFALAVFVSPCVADSGWSVNTLGYRPSAQKIATIRADDPGPVRGFQVVREHDGSIVFEGELTCHAERKLLHADFSELREPGRYLLTHEGTGASPRFAVAEDVYAEPFRVALQAMTLWRCGCAVKAEHDGQTFSHEACHLADAECLGADGPSRDAVGGWHDAGDYNKYVVNAGVSVGCLLRAWSDFGPQVEAVVGDVLRDEVRWELEWLLKVQRPDGSVAHKVSTLEFGPFIPPEEETEPRYFSDWGTAATASFTAMTAAGARAFTSHDSRFAKQLHDAALLSHALLIAHPEERRPDLSSFKTGGYQSSDRDDRLWALAEIWELTGDANALSRLELAIRDRLVRPRRRRSTSPPGYFDRQWGWGNVANLGLVTYLRSERAGRAEELVGELTSNLIATAESIAEGTASHPFGRPLRDRYYWGCNGAVALQAVVLQNADRLAPTPAFARSRRDALHYLFGRNPFGRSFVTGLGHDPPQRPHDRRSGSDGVAAPWPGYLVGGPERGPLDWRDDQNDYRTNEIAINWNAALIYALAAELPTPTDN